ncbi:GNAT family N-acetyltransferase [Actinomadura sp. KC216]|uniref:GNAT family N-acetyltransferase n=1 Tax=Actinomadura sp. KC216 TaxID=2530370 RepID=UPI00104B8225|nr:GNAT family N-acetyltransferase [Actinomadura sp. KC216]TDB91713.1 GNAT family N-acetyltransferase [Actinomadura sp. KC216]
MGWTLTDDLQEFLARADGFLRRDPVANTVALTVTGTLREQGPGVYGKTLFGWWADGGPVEGTVLRTGAYPPLLSAMPERAAQELARALARRGEAVPDVNGARAAAGAFAGTWLDETGAAGRVTMRQRLYRLDRLRVPDPPPDGAARVAGGADRALLREWFAAFDREAGGHGGVNPAVLDRRLADGCITFWEVGGRPVAVAGRTQAVAGVARVAPVYTPAGHRRRGYGAAVTAAVTRAALDAGAAGVVLFTDLANPTSNGVYQRLGYRPVEDRVVLTFA